MHRPTLLNLLFALATAASALPASAAPPRDDHRIDPSDIEAIDQTEEVSTGPRMSLDAFLERALGGNPAIAIARARLAEYEAKRLRATWAWTPRLKVGTILAPLPERKLLKRCVLDEFEEGLPLVGPCPGQDIEDDVVLEPDTEIGILTRTTGELTLPIYTFGKIEAGQKAARAGVDAGRAGIEMTRAELRVMVKRAFYGAQLAHSALDIIGDGRSRLRAAKKDISKELSKESGRFTRNDLRKLLVKEAELETGFLETEALAEQAWEGLRLAGGFRPGEPFTLDTMELAAVHIEPRTPEGYYELALLSRPDVRAMDAAVRASEGFVDLAQAEFYPDIALVAAFGFAKGTSAEDNPDPFANDPYNGRSWGVVLGAEWRLDFATRLSKLREEEAVLARRRAERDALRQLISLRVSEKWGNVRRYRRAIETQRLAMKAARGWIVSNTLNFGLGLATTDDLLDALVAYGKARLTYFQNIYEYNVAVARLSQEVGTELAVPAPDTARPSQPAEGDASTDDEPTDAIEE